MIDFIKRNKQFLFMLLIWIGVGGVLRGLDFVIIPFCFIALKRKSRYMEMIIAFECGGDGHNNMCVTGHRRCICRLIERRESTTNNNEKKLNEKFRKIPTNQRKEKSLNLRMLVNCIEPS